MDDTTCRICGSKELRGFEAREMFFATRERFLYRECASCGCIQIADYPDDLGRHYPGNYYARRNSGDGGQGATLFRRFRDGLKSGLMAMSPRARAAYLGRGSTQTWLATRAIRLEPYLRHVPDPRSRILDVGCGTGRMLKDLHSLFYRDLHGVDRFIDGDVMFAGRRLVRKATLEEVQPAYDCISFHHSLEHMPHQDAVLREVRRLLVPDGVLIMRIPAAGGHAWRHYGRDWVQLDPPRHFYLHSERSFRLLAGAAGFEIVELEYDSTRLQFWASELYRRDIGLEEGFAWVEREFSPAELAEFDRRAEELNGQRDGDQFMAVLRKR